MIQALFTSLRHYASLPPNLTRPVHLFEPLTIARLHEVTRAAILRDTEVLGKWLAVLLYSLELRPTPGRSSSRYEPEIRKAERQFFPAS